MYISPSMAQELTLHGPQPALKRNTLTAPGFRPVLYALASCSGVPGSIVRNCIVVTHVQFVSQPPDG